MIELHGAFPYLVSPVDDEGHVRRGVLARLVDHLVTAGVHGLTPLGSTGEFAYLTTAQRLEVVEAVVEAAPGRGADGVLAILEAYFPVPDAGVEDYFRTVADATDGPVVLYTNPQFQRSDLSLTVIRRLSEVPNIVGIKDASTNTGRLLSILNDTGGRLRVFAASAHIPACVIMLDNAGRLWLNGAPRLHRPVAERGTLQAVGASGMRPWRCSDGSGR